MRRADSDTDRSLPACDDPGQSARVDAVDRAERNPCPRGELVELLEQHPAGTPEMFGQGRHRLLETVPFRAGPVPADHLDVVRPDDHPEVMLTEPVAEGALGVPHLDRSSGQDVLDAGGPGGVAVEQPGVALGLVDPEQLLRHPVDPGGEFHQDLHARLHHCRGVVAESRQHLEAPAHDAVLREPVAAVDHRDRESLSGQHAHQRVGRRRDLDLVEVVPQESGDGCNAFLRGLGEGAAGVAVGGHRLDLGRDPLGHVLRDLRLPRRREVGDRLDQCARGGSGITHLVGVLSDLVRFHRVRFRRLRRLSGCTALAGRTASTVTARGGPPPRIGTSIGQRSCRHSRRVLSGPVGCAA